MAVSSSQLSLALTSPPNGLPTPSPSLLTRILSPRPQPPLPTLLTQAKHALLTADLTVQPSVLAPHTPFFPADLSHAAIRERRLAVDIPVQVLDVEDLTRSRWEQIEALEALERGEGRRGRAVVRVDEMESESVGVEMGAGVELGGLRRGPHASAMAAPGAGAGAGATHRLVLQDVRGLTVYGLEVKRVAGIGVGMGIGMKMVLRGGTTVVARGCVLLEPDGVMVLGGRVESLHRAWVEGRKRELLRAVEPEVAGA